jgi:hypothetical protein
LLVRAAPPRYRREWDRVLPPSTAGELPARFPGRCHVGPPVTFPVFPSTTAAVRSARAALRLAEAREGKRLSAASREQVEEVISLLRSFLDPDEGEPDEPPDQLNVLGLESNSRPPAGTVSLADARRRLVERQTGLVEAYRPPYARVVEAYANRLATLTA